MFPTCLAILLESELIHCYTLHFKNCLKSHVIMAWSLRWWIHPWSKRLLDPHFVRDTITTASCWTLKSLSVSWISIKLPGIWFPIHAEVLCILSNATTPSFHLLLSDITCVGVTFETSCMDRLGFPRTISLTHSTVLLSQHSLLKLTWNYFSSFILH